MKPTNLFSCIVAAVLTFAAASCSDEPTTKGGSHGLSGRKVAFSTKVSSDGNTKKVYLGTQNDSDIPVLWNIGDEVTIYSNSITGEDDLQWGIYTVNPDEDDASTASLVWKDGADTGAEIEWVASGMQEFFSTFGSNYIFSMTPYVNGYTIPAVQSGMRADGLNSSPYAVGNGSYMVDLDVGDRPNNVMLSYTLIPDIIRLTIPAGDGITSVTLSNADPDWSLSGTFGFAENYEGYLDDNKGDITVSLGGTVTGGTAIDVYTLALWFTSISITVSGPNGSCTKTLSTPVSWGEVRAVSFGSYTLKKEFVMQVKAGGTYQLANKWGGAIYYSINNNGQASLASGATAEDLSLSQGDIVRVWEGSDNVFRSWNDNVSDPLIRLTSGAQAGNVSLLSMPAMNYFTTNATGQAAGDNFFYCFNSYGALTSLPEGSFNTSNITTVGDNFFCYFNEHGALTSLPEGSFNTSNINTVGSDFFTQFNNLGKIKQGDDGDVVITNITESEIIAYYWHGTDDGGADAEASSEISVGAGGTMIYKKQ